MKDSEIFLDDIQEGERFVCLHTHASHGGYMEVGKEYILEISLVHAPYKTYRFTDVNGNAMTASYSIKTLKSLSYNAGKSLEVFPVDRLTDEELFIIRMSGNVEEVFGKRKTYKQ